MKALNLFLSIAVALSSIPAYANNKVDDTFKKVLSRVVEHIGELEQSEQREALIAYFDKVANSEYASDKRFKKLTVDQQRALTQIATPVMESAANYSQLLKQDRTADPLKIAQAFSDESEQAMGPFAVVGFIAATTLTAALVIGFLGSLFGP